MEVTILSLYANRPDFIPIQFKNFKKYLKDKYKWVVINNAYYKHDKPVKIQEICDKLGIETRRILHQGTKPYASMFVRDSLNFLWAEYKETKGILVILDCDVFFTKDFSFKELLGDEDIAFCPNFTDGIIWPWPGFMVFNMDKLSSKDIDFGFMKINGQWADVGSKVFKFLSEHEVNVRTVDRRAILHEDWPVKGNDTLYTLGFPKPYSVDFIGDFAFHYKTSGNYAEHCTPKYNKQKTKALKDLLKL